jgi:hypothetical protein
MTCTVHALLSIPDASGCFSDLLITGKEKLRAKSKQREKRRKEQKETTHPIRELHCTHLPPRVHAYYQVWTYKPHPSLRNLLAVCSPREDPGEGEYEPQAMCLYAMGFTSLQRRGSPPCSRGAAQGGQRVDIAIET